MRQSSLAFSFAALAWLAAPAHATCPTSTYYWGGLNPVTPIPMIAAANDTTFRSQPCESMHGRYQLNAGLLLAATYGCPAYSSFPAVTGLETVVEDDFTVTGLAPGTPVTIDAVLDLRGLAESFSEPGGGGGGRVRGLIREGASHEVVLERATTPSSSVNLNESLTLTVNAVAGTPVLLRFAVRAECMDGRAEMEATFRFAGLPPGAFVQSCRGYTSTAPVPTRTTTWGALKTHHR